MGVGIIEGGIISLLDDCAVLSRGRGGGGGGGAS